jgi:hypothetical protein
MTVNEFLQKFIEDEINAKTYLGLWQFVKSDGIVRGTYECQNYVVMKIAARQLIIYKICVGAENVAVQDACVVARDYFLKKINSRAYALGLPDIHNVYD